MIFNKGDKVKHKARGEWGIGLIVKVHNSNTVVVKFENHQEVSIIRGNKILIKVDDSGNTIKTPEIFKAGERVISEKHREWGIGKILADSYGSRTKVYFENQGTRQPDSIKAKLVKVTGEKAANLFLDNLSSKTIEEKGTIDKQPFPQIVETFLERFKGGLGGPLLVKEEREYKQQAHKEFVTLLNQENFKKLLDTEQWSALAGKIKKCHTINLLSKFELIHFSDVLKNPQAQQDIGKGLYIFLYGALPIQDRFKSYADLLESYKCDKWPIITLPLFLRFPENYMFVKPTVTQEAAENRDFDIQYESQLNWNTYNQVLLFSQDLFERLTTYDNPALKPRDMIDVQTFMWCTFTKGWDDIKIAKAEDKLKAPA